MDCTCSSPDPSLLLQKWVWFARLQWNLSNTDTLKTTILVLSSEVFLFQGSIYVKKQLGIQSSILINKCPYFQACPLREVPLYACSNSGGHQYILFGTWDWSMLSCPSRDYLFAWDHYTLSDKISHAFLLYYANKQ